jgi:hypothetical protein
MFACEKISDKVNHEDLYHIARIAGFDLNCSTCILEFPKDSLQIKEEIGKSPGNYYQTINLHKGDYEIGQKVKVKIRKPDVNELTPCITLYPSYNYENVYVTEFENFDNLILNDTVQLKCGECLYDSKNQFYICIDSVLNDSRCPSGANCIWSGNAEVRFIFEKLNHVPILFTLNTHIRFLSYIVLNGYRITLLDLDPYPTMRSQIDQKNYKAEIIISKE